MFKQELPCQLTHEEISKKANDLAIKLTAFRNLKTESKEVASEYKNRLGIMDREIRHLTDVVMDGMEDREVECDFQSDYENGIVKTLRLDTREVIEERPMREDERQMNIEDAPPEEEPEKSGALFGSNG